MQGLHEILEQFLVFQPENSAYVASAGTHECSGALIAGVLRLHPVVTLTSVPLGRAYRFLFDGYLKNCHSI